MKKLVSMILLLSILSSAFMVPTFAKANVNTPNSSVIRTSEKVNTDSNKTNDKIIQVISNNITVTKHGISLKDESLLIKNLEALDISSVQKDAESKGVVFNEALTAKSIVRKIKEGIKTINYDIAKGKTKVLENGTIIQADDDSFYLQGGSTYDQTYWWGKRRYMSTDRANLWNRDLNKAAAVNGGAAILAGAVFGGVGAIPNGLTSAYCGYLASDVAYYNGLNSRGIVTDLNWWLTYSMRNQ